jgi:hypothetical protein
MGKTLTPLDRWKHRSKEREEKKAEDHERRVKEAREMYIKIGSPVKPVEIQRSPEEWKALLAKARSID